MTSIETTPLTEQYCYDNRFNLSWSLLCAYQTFSTAFMRTVTQFLDWYYVSLKQQLDDQFVLDFRSQLCWVCICSRPNLVSETTLQTCFSYIAWWALCKNYKLSESFLRYNKYNLDYDAVSKYQTLSEQFMRDFKDKLNWKFLTAKQSMSISFLSDPSLFNLIAWPLIAQYQTLTEQFMGMSKFQAVLNWDLISLYQNFGQDFFKINITKLNNVSFQCVNFQENVIRQFFDKFNKAAIWTMYPCSEQLMYDYRDSLDFNLISQYQTLSESFMNYFSGQLSWGLLSIYQVMSEQFISNNNTLVNWTNIGMSQMITDDNFINNNINQIDWSTTAYNYKPSDPNLINTYVVPNYTANNWLYLGDQAKFALLGNLYTVETDLNGVDYVQCYVVTDANGKLQTYNRKFVLTVGENIVTVNCYNSAALTQQPGIVCTNLAIAQTNKGNGNIYMCWAKLSNSVLLQDTNNSIRTGNLIVKQQM